MLDRPDQPRRWGRANPPRWRARRRSSMRSTTPPACASASCRSKRPSGCWPGLGRACRRGRPPRCPAASAASPGWPASARSSPASAGSPPRPCRSARHRPDRAARSCALRAADHRARPAHPGGARRLRGLPYRGGRTGPCRRPGARDPVRHGDDHQHHARCRDRHRRLVLSRFRAGDARGRPPRDGRHLYPAFPPPLSELRQGQRCRPAGALRLPDGAARGEAGQCGKPANFFPSTFGR